MNTETFRTITLTYPEAVLLGTVLEDYERVCLNTPVTNYFTEDHNSLFFSILKKVREQTVHSQGHFQDARENPDQYELNLETPVRDEPSGTI